jgi:hypothetical protein
MRWFVAIAILSIAEVILEFIWTYLAKTELNNYLRNLKYYFMTYYGYVMSRRVENGKITSI